MFDPFFSTKGKNIGTGLGLSMVHGIVQGHNGAISLTSKAYDLTRFTVLLPRMDPEADEDRPAEHNVCLCLGSILFVEDDPEQRQSVPRIIEKLGYLVTAAGTLEQGIRILGEQAGDILLLDVGLPDGNGLEALPRIKEVSKSSPEIFIITVLSDPAGAETAITEGVLGYIVKPTAIKETRANLTRALKYRQEKQSRQQAVTLEQIIAATNGDVKRILNLSGLSKSHFYSLIKKYGIQV